ncbi:ATP-binding protein [Streptomyces noursei]|uniref:ATP-binding protein n=1 Tax=Streptomyces noursei TaxID=1971 RepID=UPI0037F4ED97
MAKPAEEPEHSSVRHSSGAGSEAGTQHYRQKLTADPKQVGCVRRIVTAYLRYWGWEQFIDPAVLCVTEMLSNVQSHADSDDCVLLLQTSSAGVRIVVSDDSQALPVVREPDWLAERGRGMFLLSSSVDAWGADLTCEGKDVWIEFWGRGLLESRVGVAVPARPEAGCGFDSSSLATSGRLP